MTTTEDVLRIAKRLNTYATWFDYSDWAYTRDTKDLEHIRYTSDYTGYNRWWRRVSRGIKHGLMWNLADWEKDLLEANTWRRRMKLRLNWKQTWISLKVWCRKDHNKPDGVLNGGQVITFWEETGELLDLMSPEVGEILSEWMTAEPDNPFAVRIAERMQKGWDGHEPA